MSAVNDLRARLRARTAQLAAARAALTELSERSNGAMYEALHEVADRGLRLSDPEEPITVAGILGSMTSRAKSAAARRNGAKGGRPRRVVE